MAPRGPSIGLDQNAQQRLCAARLTSGAGMGGCPLMTTMSHIAPRPDRFRVGR
jgi:hypothetical protein